MARRRQPQRRYYDPGRDPRPPRMTPRTTPPRPRTDTGAEAQARLAAAQAKRDRKAQRRLTQQSPEST